jgi:hypothetical protein
MTFLLLVSVKGSGGVVSGLPERWLTPPSILIRPIGECCRAGVISGGGNHGDDRFLCLVLASSVAPPYSSGASPKALFGGVL